MKNKAIYLAFGLSCFALLSSCKQEKVPIYESNPGVYFYSSRYVSENNYQKDSATISLYAKGTAVGERYAQYLDLRTVGFPQDYNRPVKIVQTNAGEPGAAVAGVDYVVFDDPAYADQLLIPAGQTSNLAHIFIINNTKLQNASVRLEIAISENDHFSPVIPEQSSFVFKFSGMPERPIKWQDRDIQDWFAYFGKWSREKMIYVSKVTGVTDFDYEYDHPQTDFRYYSRKVYNQWKKEYDEENPLLDEDGNIITFPSTYV